jgi:translation initiation factor IF-2
MNFTELARKLRIPPKELRILLPELGFDVGKKAIKVDDKVALNILKNWSRLMADYQAQLSMKEQVEAKQLIREEAAKETVATLLPARITIKELATKLNLQLNMIMKELMKNGVMVSLNEQIDFDTASIIAEDLGKRVELEDASASEKAEKREKATEMKEKLEKVDAKDLEIRPPVIIVMGHVDHGKTKLLDSIRETNIIEGESGGITQHIGAYQIEKNNRLITFIDTPGHEAFTSMRTRGSRVADIAILVVAADDGVQPQTKEALRIIKNANIPMVVAINKIDKPDANIERVKKELSEAGVTPEDWGGDTPVIGISAKSGENIDVLLETLLIIADVEKKSLFTDWKRLPIGTVIESHVDSSEGTVATILVQAGVLKPGAIISINNAFFGRVRVMKNHVSETVSEANPGMPVKLLGLKHLPIVGDIIEFKASEKGLDKKVIISSREQFASPTNISKKEDEESNDKDLKLILKTDTLCSSEAIVESLAKLNLPQDFKIDIIHKGLGNINENDVNRAETADALLVGFHVSIPSKMAELAKDNKVELEEFTIIYDLLNYLRAAIIKRANPQIRRQETGTLKILKYFSRPKDGHVVGGRVLEGEIKHPEKCDVMRKGLIVGEGKIIELQSGKEAVTTVSKGQECGLKVQTLFTVEPEDELIAYNEIEEKIDL